MTKVISKRNTRRVKLSECSAICDPDTQSGCLQHHEATIIIEYQIKTYQTLPSDKSDKKSKFTIFLNGEVIGLVNSPAYDGARLLLKMGYDPDRLMTTKSVTSQHNSWKPQPIHKFAKLTVKERDKSGMAVEGFIQFPGVVT